MACGCYRRPDLVLYCSFAKYLSTQHPFHNINLTNNNDCLQQAWQDESLCKTNNISTANETEQFMTLVLTIRTYGCEGWTVNADTDCWQQLKKYSSQCLGAELKK